MSAMRVWLLSACLMLPGPAAATMPAADDALAGVTGADWAEMAGGASCAVPGRVLRFVPDAAAGLILRVRDQDGLVFEPFDSAARQGEDLRLTYEGPGITVTQIFRISGNSLRLWDWRETLGAEVTDSGEPETVVFVDGGLKRVGDDGEVLATGQPTPAHERCAADVPSFDPQLVSLLAGGRWVAGGEGACARPGGLVFDLLSPLPRLSGAAGQDGPGPFVSRVAREGDRLEVTVGGVFDAVIEEFMVREGDRLAVWSSGGSLTGAPVIDGRLEADGSEGPVLVKCPST